MTQPPNSQKYDIEHDFLNVAVYSVYYIPCCGYLAYSRYLILDLSAYDVYSDGLVLLSSEAARIPLKARSSALADDDLHVPLPPKRRRRNQLPAYDEIDSYALNFA
jgi:hypothetical protein